MERRPDPDRLLQQIQANEARAARGQLKIFFGAYPGVGKTYTMLEAALQRKREGVDAVVGVVETHNRPETAALLEELEVIPRRQVAYRGIMLAEFDLDAALARRPALVLVDELAHSNGPGSRHAKRWQDVEELLAAGIDVYTTLNVQHWESLNDVVAQITGVRVRETVPDTVLSEAEAIELVDLSPEDLLQRMAEGKVYMGHTAVRAAQNFFRVENLTALRELALRHTAERVDRQVQAIRDQQAVPPAWPIAERLLVGVTASPMSPRLVRATARMAAQLRAEWIAVHVETPAAPPQSSAGRARIQETLRLAETLGGEAIVITGQSAVEELLAYARRRNVTKIVLGKPAEPRWKEWLFGSMVNEIARRSGAIDLYVISGRGETATGRRLPRPRQVVPWRGVGWAAAVVALCTLLAWPLLGRLDRASLIMLYLLGVMGVAYRWGRWPAIVASVLGVISFDFFYVPPYLTFAVSDAQYLIIFAVMLAVGVLISMLTGRLRRQILATRQREERMRALYELNRSLSKTPDPGELLRLAGSQLEVFYSAPVLLLRPDTTGRLQVAAGDPALFGFQGNEVQTAQWVYVRGEPAGHTTDTLAGARGLYLPLKGLRSTVGVLAIRPTEAPAHAGPEQLRLLETFAASIGGALESTRLSEEAGRAGAKAEAEQLKNLVLRTFSVDLTAPLEKIRQTAESLLDLFELPGVDTRTRYGLHQIIEECRRILLMAATLPHSFGMEAPGSALQKPAPDSQEEPGGQPSGEKLRIADFLSEERILFFEDALPKETVLARLVLTLRLPSPEIALREILDREAAGSTEIGEGLAIPHARLEGQKEVQAAIGILRDPSPRVVLLFLSPAEDPHLHLVFLAAVTRLFLRQPLVRRLSSLASPREVLDEIRRAE